MVSLIWRLFTYSSALLIFVLVGCFSEPTDQHEQLEFDVIRSSTILNNVPVEIVLRRSDNQILGFYIDKTDSSIVSLKGKMTGADQFKLKEIHAKGNIITFTGSWHDLTGVWEDLEHQLSSEFELIPDSTFSFSLKKKNQMLNGVYQNINNDGRLDSRLELEYMFDNIFFFETQSKSENCVGWIGGIMQLTRPDSAVFKDKYCTLSFNLNEDIIDIEEISCAGYHGLHCPFTGSYMR